MTSVRVRYDGWVALPAAFRRLGLATGTELDAELAGGAIVLRPGRAGWERTGAGRGPPLGTRP
jgi:hypothetical protein